MNKYLSKSCMRRVPGTAVLSVILVMLLVLSGCVTASKLLDRAEAAWAAGQYAESIYQALGSYEKAVERNKDPDEIDSAKKFLIERFPQANENLLNQAKSQANGTDTEKAVAWQTYQVLVDLNRRVKDSIASSFLKTADYTAELQKAKETAAQIKYVKGLELMGQNRRDAYIEAVGVFREIDSFVPDYRDIRVLITTCIEAGTIKVAFSDRDIYFKVVKGSVPAAAGLGKDVQNAVQKFIASKDNPEFLKFITAGSSQTAKDNGAVLFIEVQGEVTVSSETVDKYLQDGSITWKRSYSGSPSLIVTRIKDTRTEVASTSLKLAQSVSVEFFPKKFGTTSITADMYNNQFNNSAWMNSQLSRAVSAVSTAEGSAGMIVWAQMQYGGIADFLTTALVPGAEGNQSLPIDPAVYGGTQTFINQTLPAFLKFADFNLRERVVKEINDQFLMNAAIQEMLSSL